MLEVVLSVLDTFTDGLSELLIVTRQIVLLTLLQAALKNSHIISFKLHVKVLIDWLKFRLFFDHLSLSLRSVQV